MVTKQLQTKERTTKRSDDLVRKLVNQLKATQNKLKSKRKQLKEKDEGMYRSQTLSQGQAMELRNIRLDLKQVDDTSS